MPSERASPIPVLYLHRVGSFGGSSRSLLEFVTSFPEQAVVARVVTKRGNVAPFFPAKVKRLDRGESYIEHIKPETIAAATFSMDFAVASAMVSSCSAVPSASLITRCI